MSSKNKEINLSDIAITDLEEEISLKDMINKYWDSKNKKYVFIENKFNNNIPISTNLIFKYDHPNIVNGKKTLFSETLLLLLGFLNIDEVYQEILPKSIDEKIYLIDGANILFILL